MKVAIIGAGWYGCHIGVDLVAKGHDVRVFEARQDVLEGASGYNQNRLHQGFHYPRSGRTRAQTVSGFSRFQQTYPNLSEAVDRNVYAVSEEGSTMDAITYCQVMAASGLYWKNVPPKELGLSHASAALIVPERVIRTDIARMFFRESLGDRLLCSQRVERIEKQSDRIYVDSEPFDLVVNCTWAGLRAHVWHDRGVFFNACVTLLYEHLDAEQNGANRCRRTLLFNLPPR